MKTRLAAKDAAKYIGCVSETVTSAFRRRFEDDDDSVGESVIVKDHLVIRRRAEKGEAPYSSWVYDVYLPDSPERLAAEDTPEPKEEFEEGARYTAGKLGELLGRSAGYVYYHFKDNEVDGASKIIGNHRVTQHAANPDSEDVRGNTEWVYSAKNLTPSPERAAVTHATPSEERIQKDWREVQKCIREAKDTLKDISVQTQDPAAIRDDEVWQILSQDRKKALEVLRKSRETLGDIVTEAPAHFSFLSKQDVVMLNYIHTYGITAKDLQELIKRKHHEARARENSDKGEDTPPTITESKKSSKPKNPLASVLENTGQKQPQEESEPSALIYGGDPRPAAIRNIKDQMGYNPVYWVKKDRKVESAVTQVENGKYDVVFVLLRYASHGPCEQFKEACKQSNTLFVPVEHGYGVSTLTRALAHAKGEKVVAHGSRSNSHIGAPS